MNAVQVEAFEMNGIGKEAPMVRLLLVATAVALVASVGCGRRRIAHFEYGLFTGQKDCDNRCLCNEHKQFTAIRDPAVGPGTTPFRSAPQCTSPCPSAPCRRNWTWATPAAEAEAVFTDICNGATEFFGQVATAYSRGKVTFTFTSVDPITAFMTGSVSGGGSLIGQVKACLARSKKGLPQLLLGLYIGDAQVFLEYYGIEGAALTPQLYYRSAIGRAFMDDPGVPAEFRNQGQAWGPRAENFRWELGAEGAKTRHEYYVLGLWHEAGFKKSNKRPYRAYARTTLASLIPARASPVPPQPPAPDPEPPPEIVIEKPPGQKEPLEEVSAQMTEAERIQALRDYKSLLDEGIITRGEFEKKKRELLERGKK